MKVQRNKTIKVKELKHPEVNARKHPEKQIEEFVRSLEKFGQIRPFVIDEENVVWCGNGMLEAMLRMGIDTAIADIYSGMTESDKKKLMLADNKISDLGIDDKFAMEELFGSVDDFDIPGFDEAVLDALYGDVDEDALDDYGEVTFEQRQEFEKASERKEEAMNGEMEEPEDDPADDEEDGRTVTCPHCGGAFHV